MPINPKTQLKTNVKLMVHEIIDLVQASKPKDDRVALLKQHNSFELRTFLQLGFNDRIALDLPEGAPPYKKSDLPQGIQRISAANIILNIGKQLSTKSTVSKARKEKLFVGMLEQLHARDAEVLIFAKDKKLTEKFPKLTAELVKEAFPALFT